MAITVLVEGGDQGLTGPGMQDTGERPVCPWLLSEIPATLPASVRCNLIGAREEGVGVLRATLRVRVRAR